ncbi:hypothetical protein [Pectobacterium quasiaquaticum]|uniref:hypothetical protein n=1 Tax=Pectobacterium quasiaquaticum TaxID=2774015 RepID=UPI001CF76A85|nr:hypothetical protein [Pectobacterium quasiaquaticum]
MQNKEPLIDSITVGIGMAGDKVITYGNKLNPMVSDRAAESVGAVVGALSSEAATSEAENQVKAIRNNQNGK